MAVAMPQLFALLIGIDKYESNNIRPLRGAVADARAVEAYLQDQLSVPRDHITILQNESATRAAILEELLRLANDPRIRLGDPIVIFYAGHGHEVTAPPGWEAGGPNSSIQLTLPYDVYCKSGDEVVAPIPDRTLGSILEQIAQQKGNNIVVIMDSSHSASGTRSFNDLSLSASGPGLCNDLYNFVPSVPLAPNFQFQGNLDRDLWSLFPANGGLRSHVLLSASGPALESNGRGVFTVALLDVLRNSQIETLRYCDIVMRMNIASHQIPYCEGFYRDRYIFTTTSPRPIECFIPAYIRTSKRGPFAFVLNGGAAHGLVVEDEFVIYPDEEADVPMGTVVADVVGPFYSIARSTGAIQVGGHSIALAKETKRQPLRLYTRPEDPIFKILLSLLRDRAQEAINFVIVDTQDECNIDLSMQDDQAFFRPKSMPHQGHIQFSEPTTQGFGVEPTADELTRILKASCKFFSELDRNADFPDITQHVLVEIFGLQRSQFRFPGAPTTELLPQEAVPCESESYTLRQGSSYGLKLTNNNPYDLYPTVQYFDPINEFKFDTWYEPACSQSRLVSPLKKGGGSLAVGYGSGGSPPLVIPSLGRESFGFLKISLFSRPRDPFYDVQSFRLARYLPDSLKGPWVTIIKPIIHRPSEMLGLIDSQQLSEEFIISQPTGPPVEPYVPRSIAPYHGEIGTISSLSVDPHLSVEHGLGQLKLVKMQDAV